MRYLLLILMLASPVMAVQPNEILDDPVMEARAREVSKGLRCLVCRNENIDDSNAELARDLRLMVRERIVSGDSNAETTQYIVDRYGEYVLLKPLFSMGNAILWLAAPLLLLIGGAVSVVFIRRRSKATPATDTLSDAEQKRLAGILKD